MSPELTLAPPGWRIQGEGGQTLVEPSVHTLGMEAGTGEGEEPKVAHTLCRGWPASQFNWATL